MNKANEILNIAYVAITLFGEAMKVHSKYLDGSEPTDDDIKNIKTRKDELDQRWDKIQREIDSE